MTKFSMGPNLTCLPVEYKGDFIWVVYEHSTEQVVRKHYFEEDAKEYARFINRGGAFSGFTPSFMLIEFETKSDVNDKFEKEFKS